MTRSATAFALFAAATLTPAFATDWYVDLAANCVVADGSAARPFCSVGAAVAAANHGDRVLVRPGTYFESLAIVDDIEVIGVSGAAVTVIDAAQSGFAVDASGVRLTLVGLTLMNGRAAVGAGVHSQDCDLELRHCRVTSNFAFGSVPSVAGGQGAGIWTSGGTLTLVGVRIDGNVAQIGVSSLYPGFGGGIASLNTSRVVLRHTTIEDNSAERFAAVYLTGAAHVELESVTVRRSSSLTACSSTLGVVLCDDALFESCTFSSENASGEGLRVQVAGAAGARVDHCTFTGGCAPSVGFWRDNGATGTLTIANSLVAGATPIVSPTPGGYQSGGHNLFEAALAPAYGFVTGVQGDTVGLGLGALQLGPCQDNGGATWTIKPGAASPALGAADPLGLVATDQRGAPRLGAVRDSGAFEATRASATTVCVALPNSTGRAGALDVTGDSALAARALALTAYHLPAHATCLFLTSRTAQLTTAPGGSAGNLCLGLPAGSFARPGELRDSGPYGICALPIDPLDLPQPTGAVAALVGETWVFQAWHRDVAGAGATSNFTDAAALLLQ
ncbi:MAG: right-handed parallel beta-helix repeat-containing protein [Planctomycetota bacterium]